MAVDTDEMVFAAGEVRNWAVIAVITDVLRGIETDLS